MPTAVRVIDQLRQLSDVSGTFVDDDVLAYAAPDFVPGQRMESGLLADDTAGTEGARLIGANLGVTGSVGQTQQEVNNERWSVKRFGAVADGVTDDLPAFTAAILAMSAGSSSAGQRLYVPAGTYRLSGPIRVQKQIVLYGEAGGELITTGGTGSGSILLVDAGQHGIIVDMWATSPAPGGDGSGSVIENLTLTAASKSSTAHGIVMWGRASIKNCYIYGFSGDGVHIDGIPSHNCNGWIIEKTLCYRCDGNGIYVTGLNGNAGVCTLGWAKECGGWGFWDSSGLGNTYVGCWTEGNTGAYYCATDAGGVGEIRSLYLGCYSEAGQDPSFIQRPSITLGGTHGAGFYGDSRGMGPAIDTDSSRTLRVQNAIEAWNLTAPSQVWSSLCTDEEEDTVQAFGGLGAGTWRLKYGEMATGWFTWVHDNNANRRALSFSTEEAAEGPGNVGLNAVYLGMPNYTRYFGVWPSVPTEYTWRAGDILLRATPLDGSGIGWICVSGGTPGVWAEWGLASTSGASLWGRDAGAGVVTPTTSTDKLGFGVVDAYQPRLYRGADDFLQVLGAVDIQSRGLYGGATDTGPMLSVGNDVAGYVYSALKSTHGRLDAFVAYNTDDALTGAGVGNVGLRSVGSDDFLLGLGANVHLRLTETPLSQAQFSGSGRFGGTFTATTATAGAYLGVISGVPQILLGNGTAAQNWGMANGSGTLSLLLAGATELSLNAAKLALPASRFLELVSCATPATAAIAANGVALYRRSTDGHLCAEDKDGTVRDLYGAASTTILTGTATWDPPSLVDGAQTSTTVAVTGAALGDVAAVSFSLALPEFVDFYQAKVTAANTVSVTLHNWSGATVDVASGTLKAMVWKTS